MRIAFITIVLLIITWSCDEKIFTGNVNCDDCYADRPEEADLVIDLTIDGNYPRVPIVIYHGDIEDNQIFAYDTANYTPYYVYVPVDRKYSVKAEYQKNDAKLYVIDATKIKVRVVKDACDGECYVVEKQSLDARIKKDFLNF
jgi:hypothetical protein